MTDSSEAQAWVQTSLGWERRAYVLRSSAGPWAIFRRAATGAVPAHAMGTYATLATAQAAVDRLEDTGRG